MAERVAGERGLPENIAVHPLPPVGEPARTIGARTEEIAREEFVAIGLFVIVAARAMAAGIEGHDDMIAWDHLGNARPDTLDDSSTFMTEHDRLRHRQVLVAHDIGVANP